MSDWIAEVAKEYGDELDDMIVGRTRATCPAVSDWKEAVEQATKNMAAFKLRSEAEAEENAAKLAYEDDLPPPPSLDKHLVARARFVFMRLFVRGFSRMQWHNEHAWVWAATTEEGAKWFEREVSAMEMLAEREERSIRLTRERILDEGFALVDGTRRKKRTREQLVASVYAEDAADDLTILEQIHERELADEKMRRAFEEGMSMKTRLVLLSSKVGRRRKPR